MKCRFCGKKGVRLSHFMREHKALMVRRSAAGRRTSSKKASKVKAGEPVPRKGKVHRGRKREVHLSEKAAVEIFGGNPGSTSHFCSQCGLRHG